MLIGRASREGEVEVSGEGKADEVKVSKTLSKYRGMVCSLEQRMV